MIEISQKFVSHIFFRYSLNGIIKRIVKKYIFKSLIQVIDRLLFLFFIFQFFAKKKKRINNASVTIHRTISLPFLPLSTYVPCTRKTTLNAFPRSQAAINISRYAVWVSYRNTGVQTTSERTYSSHIFIEKRLDKTRLRVARLVHG